MGRGTCHEVASGVYKHITRSAQRRAPIGRTQSHEGEFLATFCEGVAGRPLSEKASSFMSKLIHEHLATEPRIQMWGVVTRGEWACGCGKRITWSDRQHVGGLQWHMLECSMAEEQSAGKAWRAAINRSAGQCRKRPRGGSVNQTPPPPLVHERRPRGSRFTEVHGTRAQRGLGSRKFTKLDHGTYRSS